MAAPSSHDRHAPKANQWALRLARGRVRRWLNWLWLPIALVQGLGVRSGRTRLLAPDGPSILTVGPDKPASKPLRLLIVGDSSVAGVGVARADETLPVQSASHLADRLERAGALLASGQSSAVSADLRDHVMPHLPRDVFDLVILVVGLNDAKNLHTSARFLREFGTLLYALKARFPSAVIAHWALSPFSIVPGLPQPLKGFLSLRSDRMDALAACLCAERGVKRFERRTELPPEAFADDGFHMSAEGCRLWADDLVTQLMASGWLDEPPVDGTDQPTS
ncbi:MAG: SGNH/GDSL hydrolase family protein [Cohaesibacteraceae bacterium]